MTPAERATEVVDLYCFMRGSGTATDERLRQDIEQAINLGIADWMREGPMVEITVGLCESFKTIGIDISEADLKRFERALYEHGLNVAPRAALSRC